MKLTNTWEMLNPSTRVPTLRFFLWHPGSGRPRREGRMSRPSPGMTRSSDAASSWRSGRRTRASKFRGSESWRQDFANKVYRTLHPEGVSLFFPFDH
jgi:hypothetical protein